MSLYQFVVNRYVIPVIEGHKAEGREEGLAEASCRVASVERAPPSPPSVKDGSSSKPAAARLVPRNPQALRARRVSPPPQAHL